MPGVRRHTRLALISIADLVAYRKRHEPTVQRLATTRIPTEFGHMTAYGYRDTVTGAEHLALVHGDLSNGHSVLTRIHSECLTGDVLGSGRCDCGDQLNDALRLVAEEGRGVLIYLRGHEGAGSD